MFKSNYLKNAQENEDIFKKVLEDMSKNRLERPMGSYIPETIDTAGSVETLYEKYSEGVRHGIFTLLNFKVDGDEATISFQDVAIMSGGGADLRYKIKENGEVEFERSVGRWMS